MFDSKDIILVKEKQVQDGIPPLIGSRGFLLNTSNEADSGKESDQQVTGAAGPGEQDRLGSHVRQELCTLLNRAPGRQRPSD